MLTISSKTMQFGYKQQLVTGLEKKFQLKWKTVFRINK